jgi:ADP-ribosylglycohydrolase
MRGVLGGDQQIVAVLGELFGQLVADAVGPAGDHGERAKIVGVHG